MAYQRATGGVAYLPWMQLVLLSAGLLVFAVELGRLLRSALAGAAAIVLLTRHVTVYDSPGIIITESLFLALLLAGLGLHFRHARQGGGRARAGAAICFALAAATRTTGTAFLLLPPLPPCSTGVCARASRWDGPGCARRPRASCWRSPWRGTG